MAEVKFVNVPNEQPLIYVNAWNQKVSNNDVILEFGDVIGEDNDTQVVRSSVKIVMTHITFLKIVEQFTKTSGFIADMYEGRLPSFPEQVTEAKVAELNEKYGEVISLGKK